MNPANLHALLIARQPPFRGPRLARGAGLVEALIALLILAFGVLGVAGLQMAALRDSQSSVERSQATLMSYSILDAMRANRAGVFANSYNQGALVCAAAAIPPIAPLAAVDLDNWIRSLQTTVGASACGQVTCANGLCTVTVEWNDTRGTKGLDKHQVQTRTQL
jgi:type IV pilus assembly protein PilV